MNRGLGVSIGVIACISVLLINGCNDPQKRIEQLEGANATLTNDLAAALQQADALKQENLQLRKDLDDTKAKAEKSTGERWTIMPGGAMTSVSEEVLFELGKAELSAGGRTALNRIVEEIRTRFPDRDIFVVGHTDNVPVKRAETKAKHPDNWHLSADRAINVAQYMISKGIPPKRITVAGCGEFRPRVPNSTGANRAKNRRVEIFVHRTPPGDLPPSIL